MTKTLPIARCGYYDYAVVDKSFEMIIPGEKSALGGLEGSTKWNREMAEKQKSKQKGVSGGDGEEANEMEMEGKNGDLWNR